MGASRAVLVGVILLLGQAGSASAQKYAPIVGAWRIELEIGGVRTLDFETHGEGFYGRGTGQFKITSPDGDCRIYPAAWSNTNPERISITGDLVLPLQGKDQSGTLVLRLTLAPAKGFAGDALFIDAALATQKGTFRMERTLSPEDLLSSQSVPDP